MKIAFVITAVVDAVVGGGGGVGGSNGCCFGGSDRRVCVRRDLMWMGNASGIWVWVLVIVVAGLWWL